MLECLEGFSSTLTFGFYSPGSPLISICTAFFSFDTALNISCAPHPEKSGCATFRFQSKRSGLESVRQIISNATFFRGISLPKNLEIGV